MAKMPVPLRDREHRLPEHGLIKFGVRDDKRKGAPKAIPWFRFCSSDRHALEQLAAQYGGKVEKWVNGYGRDQWQVTTETKEIRVVLPKDPLGEGTWYEKWKGGGCERRCDGVTCTIPRGMGGPNPEPIEVDCICAKDGALVCKPHTRLKVMLPGLDPFIGVWRLEAKGDHAMKELPGMVALVLAAQGQGMAYGILRLEERSEYIWDERTQKRMLAHYVTPVLGVATSFDALLAGEAKAVSLPSAPPPLALSPHHFDPSEELVDERDDGVSDAEVVEEEVMTPDPHARAVDAETPPASVDAGAGDPDAEIVEAEERTLRQRIAMDLGSDEIRHALARQVSLGRTSSTRELNLTELRLLARRAKRIKAGEVRVSLVDGEAKVERVWPK
jgi:hypothetical protein